MPRGTIIVVGSCNADMYIIAEHLPRPGETVLGSDFQTLPGGKGANQAVAAARAGSAVFFVANLGDDLFGRNMISNLSRERVSTDYVTLDRHNPTGVAMIVVDSSGENMITVAPGANGVLSTTQVEKARLRVRAADFVLIQMEIPRETVAGVIGMAYKENTPVMLNPSPVPARPLPPELVSMVDVMVVNEPEAAALTGVEVSDDVQAEKAARVLQEMGAARVVLTMGAGGALAVSSEAVFVPARKVDVVDTVGAGDAFCGGLVTALSEGAEFVDAVKFASAAAALACTRIGAQASLPSRTDIESFLRA